MKMGKVIQKLQTSAAVATISDGGDAYVVVLAEGYASDGKVETRANSAHQVRLFVDAASNGSAPTRTPRVVKVVDNDSDVDDGGIHEPIEPVRRVVAYPGLPLETRKPIWEHPKGFSASEHEGRDAFQRGFDKDSHCAGKSVRARDFEEAWERARRVAETAPVVGVPAVPLIANRLAA